MTTTTRQALHSSVTTEWYTPTRFTEAARRVMGSIDLDPASCVSANKTVKATEFFDKKKNGLEQKWHGNVFLNPPYGRGGQAAWSKKMMEEYNAGHITQGIMLVNAATDTKWFKPLWRYPICFASQRIKFIAEDDVKKHSPTHASVFVYFGKNRNDFVYHFNAFGPIVTKVVR